MTSSVFSIDNFVMNRENVKLLVLVGNNGSDNHYLFMLIFWGFLSSKNKINIWKWNEVQKKLRNTLCDVSAEMEVVTYSQTICTCTDIKPSKD